MANCNDCARSSIIIVDVSVARHNGTGTDHMRHNQKNNNY